MGKVIGHDFFQVVAFKHTQRSLKPGAQPEVDGNFKVTFNAMQERKSIMNRPQRADTFALARLQPRQHHAGIETFDGKLPRA